MITLKEEFLGCSKTRRAIRLGGYEVLALWLALKGYAATKLTDGFVPDEAVEDLPGVPAGWREAMRALVDCGEIDRDGNRGYGLIDPVPNGWQLHDYLEHARSSEQEQRRRDKARERKDRYENAVRNGVRNASRNGVPNAVPDAFRTGDPSPTQPSPTQPDRSDLGGAGKPARSRPKVALPADWNPNPAHAELARSLGVDLKKQEAQFRDHAEASARRLANWDAGFRSWLRKAPDFGSGSRRRGAQERLDEIFTEASEDNDPN